MNERWEPFAPEGWSAVGSAAVLIFFAFFGREAICHLSAEFRDPARDVVRSTVISVVIITVLFLGIAVATIGTAFDWDAKDILVVPNALVIVVYAAGTATGVVPLRGARRVAAVVASLLCLALLPFAGVGLVFTMLIAAAAPLYRRLHPAPTRTPSV